MCGAVVWAEVRFRGQIGEQGFTPLLHLGPHGSQQPVAHLSQLQRRLWFRADHASPEDIYSNDRLGARRRREEGDNSRVVLLADTVCDVLIGKLQRQMVSLPLCFVQFWGLANSLA